MICQLRLRQLRDFWDERFFHQVTKIIVIQKFSNPKDLETILEKIIFITPDVL